MARSRNIKPGLYQDEDLVLCSFPARYMAAGLSCWADREGRLEDRPLRLKMQMFPADDVDVNALLNELQDAGFIQRYEITNVKYIQILGFSKHQNPHCKEQESTIPEPDKHGACTGLEVKGIREEGISKGVKGGQKSDKPADIEIPDFIKKETWLAWEQFRKELKKPLKQSTIKLQIKSLEEWHKEGHDCNEIIITSIRQGWTGLFPPSERKKKSTNGSSVEHVPDELLMEWAQRNGAPQPKHTADYNYQRYRQDLVAWEQGR